MALPLPRVVADIDPSGSRIMNSLNGINDYANKSHQRRFNKVKADYADLTVPAQAYSQLAYANAVAPQILAKLMGNEGALANMSEGQKKNMLTAIQNAGFKSNNGLNMLSQGQSGGHPTGVGQPGTNSLSGWFMDKLKGAFGHGASSQQNGNALGGSASNPGQYNAPAEYASPPVPRQGQQPQTMGGGGQGQEDDGIDHEYDAFIQQWLQSPQGKQEIAKGEAANIPSPEEFHSMKNGQQPTTPPSMEMEMTGGRQEGPTYAENAGKYKGIVEEGQESGKIRAKQREDLDNAVFNSETNQQTLDDVADILASPTFENIRQTPLAGHHELAYYAKEGTPEEQQMVGKFYTLTGNLIKDASRDFAGQFRKGEQQLLNGMKPGPSDTVDSAKGKVESLSVLNKMLAQRSRLTSQLMDEYHVSKLQASDMADKKINGQAIRKEVHDRLNPTVTVRNSKTGETKTMSVAEARKLGVPNV